MEYLVVELISSGKAVGMMPASLLESICVTNISLSNYVRVFQTQAAKKGEGSKIVYISISCPADIHNWLRHSLYLSNPKFQWSLSLASSCSRCPGQWREAWNWERRLQQSSLETWWETKKKVQAIILLLIVVQYKDRRRADLRWTPRRGSIKWQSRGILFQLLWSRIWAFTKLYRLQSDPVLWFCKSRYPYLLVFSFSSNFS